MLHEFGNSVFHLGDAGCLIESPLLTQDPRTDLDHVVCLPVGAQDAVTFLDHPLVAAGDVQNGKGDEQAVARRIDKRSGCLERAAERGFAFWTKGSTFPPTLRISGQMV